eukprot:933082-Pelagomonas_calceolata.AAC.1
MDVCRKRCQKVKKRYALTQGGCQGTHIHTHTPQAWQTLAAVPRLCAGVREPAGRLPALQGHPQKPR